MCNKSDYLDDMKYILGTKIGMTQKFQETGDVVAVTAIKWMYMSRPPHLRTGWLRDSW